MLDKFGIYYSDRLPCRHRSAPSSAFFSTRCATLLRGPVWYSRQRPASTTLPEGYRNLTEYGMDLALKRVAQHKGIGGVPFASGSWQNVPSAACGFGVLPHRYGGRSAVASLILANRHPDLAWQWVCPSSPCWSCSVVPEAGAVASHDDRRLHRRRLAPAILIAERGQRLWLAASSSRSSSASRQVLCLHEVGGFDPRLIKLPLSIWELFGYLFARAYRYHQPRLIVCSIGAFDVLSKTGSDHRYIAM
ncbi:MAG: hypothetical protein ACLUEU_01075 [Oscillospiraceae bacterium]